MKLGSLFLDDDFAINLFSGCPSLESLNLDNCELHISEISCNVLKKLTLRECLQCERMQICCPGLVSLFISSYRNSFRSISLVNMTSLVYADIKLTNDEEIIDVDLPDLSVLCGLSNVTNLKLHLYDYLRLKDQWKKTISKCRTFENLKILDIGCWDNIDDFDLVACFLEHSPVLQKLILKLWFDESIVDVEEAPRQHVFFPLEYIETAEIHCLGDHKLASKLISFLGRYVKTIGNVIIT